MAGLVRFSDAISSSVSDWRLYSLRMRLAMSGSTWSRALNDIVVKGAAISRMLALSARVGRRRPQKLGCRDGALPKHVGLRAGEVEHSRGGTARRRAAVHHRGDAWQRTSLLG